MARQSVKISRKKTTRTMVKKNKTSSGNKNKHLFFDRCPLCGKKW